MWHRRWVWWGVWGAVVCAAGTAFGQDDWPTYTGDPAERGPGDYLAWYKLLLIWLVFIAWVKTTDWINRDLHELSASVGLSAAVWNPVVVFSFVVALLLALSIPIFAVGYSVLVLAFLAPLGTYIVMRNGRVTDDQKVLTAAHLKTAFGSMGKRRTKKKKVDVKHAWEQGPAVDISASGATPQQIQANLIQARQSPGFVPTKEIIADALDRRAERLMLDYTRDAVAPRYEIDGVWHNLPPRDREAADVLLAVVKTLAGLNASERRARQEGEFPFRYRESKYKAHVTSQGTQNGERVLVELQGKHEVFKTFDDIGMRDKMRDRLKELLSANKGLVILSSLPSSGLTTTWAVTLKAMDRYLKDFVAVEDKAKPKPYVENLEVVKFDAAAGETPDIKLPSIILKQPDVFAVPEFMNAKTADLLLREVTEEGRMVLTTARAKEAAEAPLRLLTLKLNIERFAEALTVILHQRLVRKLCETCKQAYEPPPQLLQKLGIPAGRVQVLFREYQPPPVPVKGKKEAEVCKACGGIGYLGRTAVFELIEVNDQFRQALVEQPRLEVLRQIARQSGSRPMQEEGIVLVAKGTTSLTELQRVLKQ